MRVDVMQHYGFTQPLSHAGYYETAHHRQLMTDIKSAILEGHFIALCGVIGSGKTVTLRRLQQQLKDENRVLVAKSLAVDKHRITVGTLITALFYDLSTEKPLRIPTQSEKRERDLRELVKKGKRPVVLFVDEAHDLTDRKSTRLNSSHVEISYAVFCLKKKKKKNKITSHRTGRLPHSVSKTVELSRSRSVREYSRAASRDRLI